MSTTTVASWIDRADMFTWLPAHAGEGAVVVMLPDAAELALPLPAYRGFLRAATATCLEASAGPTIFVQTDRMHDGRWLDKAAIIIGEAADALLWHKIALRRDVGRVDLHRPTFTHILAFGPGRPGRRTADVITGGRRRWENGVGEATARFVAKYLRDVDVTHVLNPCAGAGTFGDVFATFGIATRGCDRVLRDVAGRAV